MLVLEDVGGAEQGDCLQLLDRAGALQMAELLATYHAAWWDRAELHTADWLEPVHLRTSEWLVSRRARFLDRFESRVAPSVLGLLDRIEAVQARGDERLAGAPHTVLHADLHLDNVLFEGEQRTPVLLDWARASRGPSAIDVAELVFAMTPISELDPVLSAYLESLERRGVANVSAQAFRRQLGGALLRMVVRSTCGMAPWQPVLEREERIIDSVFARVAAAVDYWRGQDEELFRL